MVALWAFALRILLAFLAFLAFFAFLAFSVFLEGFHGEKIHKTNENFIEVQLGRLQNLVLGPPKSSLEASRALFLEDIYLKSALGGVPPQIWEPFWANSIEFPLGGGHRRLPVCNDFGEQARISDLKSQE